jgi:hypothetical protein
VNRPIGHGLEFKDELLARVRVATDDTTELIEERRQNDLIRIFTEIVPVPAAFSFGR